MATIRDRYIAARFPCTAQSSADLEDVERMIKAARLFFEDEQPDRASEILALAIGQCPGVESLRLAQLEFAFLARDAEDFRVLALEFSQVHPASKALEQVARLGRAMAPHHEGALPGTSNWIQASWNFTGDALASDFHRAMTAKPR